MTRGYASLGDGEARRAFLHTLRAVIDLDGQRVNATTASTWPRSSPR